MLRHALPGRSAQVLRALQAPVRRRRARPARHPRYQANAAVASVGSVALPANSGLGLAHFESAAFIHPAFDLCGDVLCRGAVGEFFEQLAVALVQFNYSCIVKNQD